MKSYLCIVVYSMYNMLYKIAESAKFIIKTTSMLRPVQDSPKGGHVGQDLQILIQDVVDQYPDKPM